MRIRYTQSTVLKFLDSYSGIIVSPSQNQMVTFSFYATVDSHPVIGGTIKIEDWESLPIQAIVEEKTEYHFESCTQDCDIYGAIQTLYVEDDDDLRAILKYFMPAAIQCEFFGNLEVANFLKTVQSTDGYQLDLESAEPEEVAVAAC